MRKPRNFRLAFPVVVDIQFNKLSVPTSPQFLAPLASSARILPRAAVVFHSLPTSIGLDRIRLPFQNRP